MKVLALTHGDGKNKIFFRDVLFLRNLGYTIYVVGWDRLNTHKKKEIHKGITIRYIFKGGGYKNKFLIVMYPLWVIRLIIFLLLCPRVDFIWAANFETAFPASIAKLIRRIPYIYKIHDNLCLTYNYPIITATILKWLDAWVLKNASLVIIPDKNRIEKHARKYAYKIEIVPNSQPKGFLKYSPQEHQIEYDLYVCGTIWETRGIVKLIEASKKVPGCKIIVAGNVPEKRIMKLLNENRHIKYVGNLSHEESMIISMKSKAIFAFYDPRILINRVADPIKLFESMMIMKPVVINSEVAISKELIENDAAYSCSYDDIYGLSEILFNIMKQDTNSKGQNAKRLFESKYAFELFEDKLGNIIKSVMKK